MKSTFLKRRYFTNPLYNTGCHKSVHDLLEERKTEIFTQMEILIMDSLKENLNCGIDFIVTNEDKLYGQDQRELFKALNHLSELHIIKKRNCDGDAYEWDDKHALLRILN